MPGNCCGVSDDGILFKLEVGECTALDARLFGQLLSLGLVADLGYDASV